MKFSKSLTALALAAAAVGAQAAPYSGAFFTGTGAGYDGLITGVTGFDVYSNGSAAFFCATAGGCAGGTVAFGAQMDPVSTTPLAVGDVVKTVYQGIVSKFNPGLVSPNLFSPGQEVGSYQITVAATFMETVLAGSGAPGLFATATLLPISGGRVSLFYDNAGRAGGGTLIGAAGVAAGVGYTDGLLIADGTVSGPASGIQSYNVSATTNGLTGSGINNIAGPLPTVQVGNPGTNTVGFIPAPGGFISGTTLQYGDGINGYQTGNFFDNANGWSAVSVDAAKTLRADANVDLSAVTVPEPMSLALVGLGLAAAGLSTRRRKA